MGTKPVFKKITTAAQAQSMDARSGDEVRMERPVFKKVMTAAQAQGLAPVTEQTVGGDTARMGMNAALTAVAMESEWRRDFEQSRGSGAALGGSTSARLSGDTDYREGQLFTIRRRLEDAQEEQARLRALLGNAYSGIRAGGTATTREERERWQEDLTAAKEAARQLRREYRETDRAQQAQIGQRRAEEEYLRLAGLDVDQAKRELESLRAESARAADLDTMTKMAVIPGGLAGHLAATQEETRAIQQKINALEADIEGAERIRTGWNYQENTLAPDFAQNSRYQAGAVDDLDYNYINRDPEAVQAKRDGMFPGNGMAVDIPNQYVEQMRDEEIAIFNYLYHTKGKDAADQYIAYLEPDLNARQRQKETAEWQEEAEKHPVGMSALSVVMAPTKGISYAGQAIDYLADGKIDQNAGYNRYSYLSGATRAKVSELAEDRWGEKGSFLYNTGMSMGDFLMTSLVSGGFSGVGAGEKLALGIMGSGAAADTTIAAKDRGLSDDQALLLGTAAGMAEIVTEKVSLETLLDMTSLDKSAVGYFLKNVLAEGSEEVGSDLINWYADVLVSMDKSEWQQSIDAYKAKGETDGQAFIHAVTDQVQEMGLDFLGGALSGGVMSGGGIVVNRMAGRQYDGSAQQNTHQMIKADTGLFNREILDNFNTARKNLLEYAKTHFPSQVVNQETGKTIGISRKGLDKFLSGNILYEKYASGFHIPELIEMAHKVGEAENYHTEAAKSIPTFEYYDSAIEIDGQVFNAHIRVKNTLVGDKYYGHTISEVEDIKIESPTRTSSPAEPAVRPENTGDSTDSIPESGGEIKGEARDVTGRAADETKPYFGPDGSIVLPGAKQAQAMGLDFPGGVMSGGGIVVNQLSGNRAFAFDGTQEKSNENNNVRTKITMKEFADVNASVWRNIEYDDVESQRTIMQDTHQEMVQEGRIVQIPERTMEQVAEHYPDLRTMKKAERTATLRQKLNELKASLRAALNGLKGSNFEFEVNGKVLEAKLYDTGVREVMEKITQDKASMLYHSREVFQNARYLYSLPDYDGDSNIYRWNYFYTPVQIGEDVVGVRIAVRDMARQAESQIYNWGIKKDTTLDSGGDGTNRKPTGVSSAVPNTSIPQSGREIKGEVRDVTGRVADGTKPYFGPDGSIVLPGAKQAQAMGLDFPGGVMSGDVMSGGGIVVNRMAGNRYSAPDSAGVRNNSIKKSPYTEQEADAIRHEGRTFRNIIVGIDTTVSGFFNKWQGGRKSHQGEKLEKLYLGKLSKHSLSQVSEILNYEIDSRDVIITNDDVKHIHDRHPDLQDWVFEALTDVVAQPDTVRGDHEGTGKNIGKTSIVFEKTMPGGTIVCAQFDNPGRGTMQVTSVYLKHSGKNKAAATPSMMNPPQSGATSTSETTEPVTTVTHSIPQSGGEIKGEARDVTGRAADETKPYFGPDGSIVLPGGKTRAAEGGDPYGGDGTPDGSRRTDGLNGGVRYSLKQFDDGTAFVDVDIDQERFAGLTTEEMQNEAKKAILERFRNKVIGTDYKAFVNKRAAEHYAYPVNRRMDETQKQDKMRASTELDNIISASVFRENVADDGRHPAATGGIDKLDTKFRVNGRLYEAEISVLVTERGRLFYDLTKFKDITREIGLTTHKGDAAEADSDAFINSIPESGGEIKDEVRDVTGRAADETKPYFGPDGSIVLPRAKQAQEMGLDFLGGALSGGVMSGGGIVVNRMAGNRQNGPGFDGGERHDAVSAQESTSVDTNPAVHTPEEQAVIDEYQAAVDDSILAFISKWENLQNPDYKRKIRMPIGEVTERAAQDVQRLTGVDVTGFEHAISGGALEHIENRHGKDGKGDQSMADRNDIARIGYVLEHYDDVELLDRTSTEYANSDDTPAKLVRFYKKVNGTYYVVEAVPNSKAKQMRVVSAYMEKDSGSTGQVLNIPQSGPQHTPKVPHGANASNTSIPQSGGEIKGEARDVTGRVADETKPYFGPDGSIVLPGTKQADVKAPVYTKADSGVVSGGNLVSLKLRSSVDTLAKRLGARVMFRTDMDSGINGEYDPDTGIISLNANKGEAELRRYVIGHEFVHRIQQLAPEAYNEFRKIAARERGGLVQATQDLYREKGKALTYEQALDEVTADYGGELLDGGETLDRFIAEHRDERTVLEKVRDAIRAFLDRLTGRERSNAELAVEKLTAAIDAAAAEVDSRRADGTTTEAGQKETATAGGGVRYSISYDQENTPFVVVGRDILAGIPESDWVRTVKENLRKKFPDGVTVGNSEIKINKQSRAEMTFSEYTKWLKKKMPELYADKLKATDNVDEILLATRDYVNEGLKHPRKDNIRDFARGAVQLRIGGKDYAADVIVGTTTDGSMLLYDLLNLKEIKINEKSQTTVKAANPSPGDNRSPVADSSHKTIITDTDAEGNNNFFLAGVREAAKTLTERYGEVDSRRADGTTTEAGQKETATAGGGVRYSLNPEFSAELDAWDGKSKHTFRVGTTSAVLQSIGVQDKGIIWHGGKIAEIMRKHPGMTREVIKQVPGILENPVIVLKSQQSGSRLAVFGEVYDEQGAPVTAILELQPTTRGGELLDMNVIASAYGKDTNPADFIRKSEVLYVDTNENRTQSWMQGVGLQLPSDATALGSIGTITYQDGNVKIEGVPYEQYMQEREKISNSKNSLAGVREAAKTLTERYGEIDGLDVREEQREVLREQAVREVYAERSLSTDKDLYSYEFLTALPDMEVIKLPAVPAVVGQDGKIDKSTVVLLGLENARTAGTERGGKAFVRNRYTGRELRIDTTSIRHGLHGSLARMMTNARLGAVIGDVVKNAVPINALMNDAMGVSGTYAMVSYATDNAGHDFVAVITVEQREENISGIEVYDVAHAISGRQKRDERAATSAQGVYPSANVSTISIDSFLETVKGTHQSILSEDVLEHFGETRNPGGYYTGRAKFSLAGVREAAKTLAERYTEIDRLDVSEEERVSLREQAVREVLADAVTDQGNGNAGNIPMYKETAGLVENEHTKKLSGKMRRFLDALAKRTGSRIEFTDKLAESFNGRYDPETGTLRISTTAKNPIVVVAAHEITHRMQQVAPQTYREYREYVAQKVSERLGTYAVDEIMVRYKEAGAPLTVERAMDELAAEFTEKLVEDGKLFPEIVRENRPAAQRLLDALQSFIQKVKTLFGGNTAAQNNATYAQYGVDMETVETAARLWKAAMAETESTVKNAKENTVRGGGEGQYSVTKVGGKQVVWIDNNPLTNKELRSHTAVAQYIAQHIGEMYTIIESGQEVYIGADLPNEYTQSKYTSHLRHTDSTTAKAKNKAVSGLGEMIEVATNRRWEKTKHAQNKDAKYGVYRYDSTFAFPVKDNQGNISDVKAYDVELIILNASDGKKYLYDIVNIKENTTARIDLTQRETRFAAYNAASGGDVSNGSIPNSGGNSNEQNSLKMKSRTGDLVKVIESIERNRGDKTDAEVQAEIQQAVEEYREQLIDRYGEIPAGEKPAREVHIPKRTSERERVSQTVRTVLEAQATPETAAPDIERLVSEGKFSYESYGDKEAIREAEETIRDKSMEIAYADWRNDIRQGIVSKEHTALGWTLYNNAANEGNTQLALDVLQSMVDHQRSAAQALQATRILKTLSPETQLYHVQRSVRSLQEELKKKYKDKAPTLELNEELAADFLRAETEEARDAARAALYRDIGRQMPSRFVDKWNAWRYLAMLGNARTHVRNVVGNAGFAPVVAVKNTIATGLEAAVDKVSGGRAFSGAQGERTKALTAGKALYRAAFDDYKRVEAQVMAGGKYQDFAQNSAIEEGRVIFKTKPLEWARRKNSGLLELEDSWFAKPHYAAALASYCKANGITAEQVRSGKGLDKAREYAIREAQKATYRDTNAFSQMVSDIGRYSGDNSAKKAVSVLVKGILPFRKTPANILARGVEYSPIGLVERIFRGTYQVAKGRITTAEYLDGISAGLTGSGLLGLGFLMAALGLARGAGAGDDKEQTFDELMGHQDYALELPDGTSVTLDWLAPEALPFFVGVNLYEEASRKNGGARLNMADWLSALGNVSEPMLEMSCLQSLNDLFDVVSYGKEEGSALGSAVAGAITSYLMQGLPTIFGQAERSAEGRRMESYPEASSWLTKDIQYTLGKASARVPGLDFLQVPYIDAWGREELTGKPAARVVNNFLNPAYMSKIDESHMERELLRLYDVTGDKAVFPARAGKSFTVDKVDKKLTGEEYVKYATAQGQTAYSIVCRLIESKAYKAMDDETKAACVVLAYEYAEAYARTQVSAYMPTDWRGKAFSTIRNTGVRPEDYICAYQAQKGIGSLKDANGETISGSEGLLKMEAVYSVPGLTDAQRKAMFADFGVGKSVQGLNRAAVEEKLRGMR